MKAWYIKKNANIITENTTLYNYSEQLEYDDDCVVDDCTLEEFRKEVGHSNEAPTYTFLEEKKLFVVVGIRYYLTLLKNISLEDILLNEQTHCILKMSSYLRHTSKFLILSRELSLRAW